MAKSKDAAADQQKAEQAVRQAQEQLVEATQRAADAGATLVAIKTTGVPEMEVEVLPGNMCSHNDQAYYGDGYALAPDGHKGNDRFTCDGPTAIGLMQLGHVQLVGPAT